jgi:hypothetical protein
MSNESNALPSADVAQATLDNMYQEAFFAKMAELGHVPQTQEDAIAMLEAGYQLDLIPEEKQASAVVGQYSAANGMLKQALAQTGINTGLQTQAEAGVKQAAYAFASDPAFYGAVVALRAAEAAAS